jgi:hypothetical protein
MTAPRVPPKPAHRSGTLVARVMIGGQAMAPAQTEESHAGADYERLIEWVRDHRALVVLGAGALLVISLLVTPSSTNNHPHPDVTEDETPLFI